VVDAAKDDPQKYGPLVAEMDRTGNVSKAFRALSIARDEQRILALAPVVGKFRTLLFDPPWQYDMDFLGRGAPSYKTMSHAELLALDVAKWAEDDAHMYLCSTNAMIPKAHELLVAWGFKYDTMITWVKPHYGMGSNFRGQTEHVLFGVRGKLSTRRSDIPTVFFAPVTEHSAKPEELYNIIRAASYPPYGEGFQVTPRPDFQNLFVAVTEMLANVVEQLPRVHAENDAAERDTEAGDVA
jgi:N6-adenosine-specific RNA methylase IME4